MHLSRQSLVSFLVAILAFSGCEPRTLAQREEHVLNRIGFGPSEWSLARIRQLGIKGYIAEQLQPELLDDSALEAEVARRFPSLSKGLHEIRVTYSEYPPTLGATTPRKELSQATIMRAVESKRQLEQVLVDFWFNHFNVDGRLEARWSIVPYVRDAIQPHVLGRFRDMLRATAAHPAMIEYLDNNVNFREGFVRNPDNGIEFGINENYARELLELHTLGVDAPYTLADIQNVARAMTGWTFQGPYDAQYSFVYLADGHDQGPKQVLDLAIPAGGGMDDGEALLDYLATHPLTAQHLALKLCRRFVSEVAPDTCAAEAAATFLATDGDLREVMRTILLSPDFLAAHDFRGKVKRPLHHVVSVARAVGVADVDAYLGYASGEIIRMGSELYGAGPPTGWPEASEAWTGEGTHVGRVNLGARAAAGQVGFAALLPVANPSTPLALIRELDWRFLPSGSPYVAKAEIESFLAQIPQWAWPSEAAAAVLASPAFALH